MHKFLILYSKSVHAKFEISHITVIFANFLNFSLGNFENSNIATEINPSLHAGVTTSRENLAQLNPFDMSLQLGSH